MSNTKRRRRRKPSRMSLAAIVGMILLLLFIPLLCIVIGGKQIDKELPDYATGHVNETVVAENID